MFIRREFETHILIFFQKRTVAADHATFAQSVRINGLMKFKILLTDTASSYFQIS
jgi:hypothetical protein